MRCTTKMLHQDVSSEFRILKSIFGCDSISGLPHISKNGRCATELSPCFWKRWGSEHQQSVPHPHKPTRSLCFSNFWTFRAAFSGKLFGESRRWRKKDARRGALNARGGHLRGFNLRWAAPWWISHSALLTGKTMNTSSPFFPFFRPKISFPEIGHRSNTFFPWWKTPIASYQIPKKAPTSTMKSPKNCWVVSGFRSQQHLSHTHQFVNSNSVDDDHPQSMLSIIINQQGLHYQIWGIIGYVTSIMAWLW